MRTRDALAWRLSTRLPHRDGERRHAHLTRPPEPAHAGGAEAQPSPGPPPLLPPSSPRLEPPHDAVPCGRTRGWHVPSSPYGASLRLTPRPPVASPHAAGHQAPHGLHAPLAIGTRGSDATGHGLPSPVLVVPVLGANEPTPRAAHVGSELRRGNCYLLKLERQQRPASSQRAFEEKSGSRSQQPCNCDQRQKRQRIVNLWKLPHHRHRGLLYQVLGNTPLPTCNRNRTLLK